MENYFILDKYNEVELVKFFNKIKPRYSPNTVWVIYSYIIAGFNDHFDQNLKGLVHLWFFLKLETNKYFAKKLKTFSPEWIHEVLNTLHAMNTPNVTLYGVFTVLLYYGLLRANNIKNSKEGDVMLLEEKKMIL